MLCSCGANIVKNGSEWESRYQVNLRLVELIIGSRNEGLTLSFLQSRCPPRQVRSFRVIKFRDSHLTEDSDDIHRDGQLTVWDAAELNEPGLEEGRRYIVSCLTGSLLGSQSNFASATRTPIFNQVKSDPGLFRGSRANCILTQEGTQDGGS